MWINPAVAKFYGIVTNNAGSINKNAQKVVQNSKSVFEKLTPVDVNFFKTYIIGTRMRTGITKPEIDSLFAQEDEDFYISAYNLLCKKLGLSDEICPGLSADYYTESLMRYISNEHRISINTNPEATKNLNKTQIFWALRHEFQHCMQNLKILSHETLGEKAVELYTNITAQKEKLIFDSLIALPFDEILRCGDNPQQIQEILNLKALYENNPEKYEKFLETNLKEYKDQLNTLRKNVIRLWGPVKANSKGSELVQEYFKTLTACDYYNPDGTINMGRYLNNPTEQEAFIAGDIAECDVTGKCYFRKLKDDLKKAQENPDWFADIKQQIRDNAVT